MNPGSTIGAILFLTADFSFCQLLRDRSRKSVMFPIKNNRWRVAFEISFPFLLDLAGLGFNFVQMKLATSLFCCFFFKLFPSIDTTNNNTCLFGCCYVFSSTRKK